MSRFACKVEGDSRAADAAEVRRALAALVDPGQTFEIRGLWRAPDFARSRVCRSVEDGVAAAVEMADANGVYFTLNPLRDGLEKAATNADVLSRRWMLVDCDPVKPADGSATDAERDASIELAVDIAEAMSAEGWPDAVWIESGNGAHLLYPIDLPNDKLSQQLIRDALAALGERFDNEKARVDRAVHNAARISKLPGTWARKGEETADRPHRMARLVYAPDTGGEIVTADMLRALTKPTPAPAAGKPSPWTATATDGEGLKRYVRSAIERECARVLMAPEGSRNNALNRAAFSIATMAGWPELDAADAKIVLYQAAIRAGLSEHETKLTIESGWTSGSRETRPRPIDQAIRATTPAIPKAAEPDRLVIFGSEVETKKVRWVWPDRVAVGFISLFAGRTGVGKSFVALDFVARLTTGGEIPLSPIHLPKGRALVISEDPYDYVLVPRLKEMGADLDSVAFMSWEAMGLFSLENIGMLTRAWEQAGEPVLVIIDPPANFLGSTSENKNAEVRRILMGLVAWLNDKQVACVMITHLKKATADPVEVLDRIMGSVAWASTSRVAIAFSRDEDDPTQCLMPGVKTNIGNMPDTLVYRIVKTDCLARVEWIGKSDKDAGAAFERAAKRAKKTVGMEAVEWVTARFREKRRWESAELKQAAKEDGVSLEGVFKGAEVKALPIDKRPEVGVDGNRTWYWTARPGWPEEPSESSESSESY